MSLRVRPLEERIVLDAAPTELVIVDAGVEEAEAIVEAASPDAEVILLEAGGDGVAQIGELLDGREGLDAVHIVSHGAEGGVALGDAWLDADGLDALAGWAAAFAPDGDLLLYGCDVGADGDFLEALAGVTGADVAASDDTTGAGGDWLLEARVGQIDTEAIVASAYEGTLAATFGSPISSATGGTTAFRFDSGDFDEDGNVDLVVVNSGSNNVSVMLGDGAGNFTPTGASPYSAANGNIRDVAVGDLNNDGDLDFVASTSDIRVRLGNGGGGFGADTQGSSGSNVRFNVVLTHLDAGNNLDYVATRPLSDVATRALGNGAGGFGGKTHPAVGDNPRGLAVGNFDGVNLNDAVTANRNSDNVTLLVNNGSGTLTSGGNFAVGDAPEDITVGDFDGDGDLDFATANSGAADNVTVRLGNGAGGFGVQINTVSGGSPIALAAGDLDGDGKVDLVVANDSGSALSVMTGKGDGTFTVASTALAIGTPRDIGLVDVNNDGRLDIVITDMTNSSVQVLLQNAPPAAEATAAATATIASAASVEAVADPVDLYTLLKRGDHADVPIGDTSGETPRANSLGCVLGAARDPLRLEGLALSFGAEPREAPMPRPVCHISPA